MVPVDRSGFVVALARSLLKFPVRRGSETSAAELTDGDAIADGLEVASITLVVSSEFVTGPAQTTRQLPGHVPDLHGVMDPVISDCSRAGDEPEARKELWRECGPLAEP